MQELGRLLCAVRMGVATDEDSQFLPRARPPERSRATRW